MARILIIDDETNIRTMLRMALQHVGHEVKTAADGYEGLDIYGSGEDWDLVLLDQRMPGMEGLEVLRKIRERSPDARVIMITAFGTIDLATEAMAAGAMDFLRKPFTIEILRAAVTAALEDRAGEKSPVSALHPYAFDETTVNGYRLGTPSDIQTSGDGSIRVTFPVRPATGEERSCMVTLPPSVRERVEAHADRVDMPGGERFWQALCGEALANHLWQNAELPEGDALLIDGLTSGLRRWIDSMLAGAI